MGGNGTTWDPELRLSLGRSADATVPDSLSGGSSVEQPSPATSAHHQQLQQQKQMTMFYNGQICVCDVTEIQARSIISMAKQEMDAKVEKNSRKQQQQQQQQKEQQQYSTQRASTPAVATAAYSSPAAHPQQLLNPSGLSMKRSLQRFLEKRKTRADASSPYSHQRPFFFLINS